MAIYDFFVSRNNSANVATYVGHLGRLFYDDTNGLIRISNGQPGGNIVQNPALAASSITPPAAPFEGMLWFNPTNEELWAYHNGAFVGTINPATTTKLGGIIAGPGANVSVDGTLTIDTTGLPLSIGNIQVVDTTIRTVNANDDLILESNGTGNVNVVGDFKVYKTDGDINSRLPEFRITSDGQVRAIVSNVDATSGAVSIIGNRDAVYQIPLNTGVMLQVTGQPNIPSRIYNDANNDYSGWVGRRYNGTASSPTQVLANQEILRLVGNGYTSDGWKSAGAGRFVVAAAENQALNAQGGRLEFWVTPIGQPGTNGVRNVYIDAASGLVANTATVTGNLTVQGNIVGNAVGTTATLGSATVTGNISTGNIAITGSISSNVKISGANVTANNFNKLGGNITVNGRTGQLTSLADSIAKGSAVTFRVNNSYVLSNKDVVIVNIASGASIDAYSIAVTHVATGWFNITVTNNGSGALAEAIVVNFAIINVV